MIFKWLENRKLNKLKRKHALKTYKLLMAIKEYNDKHGWWGCGAWMCCQEPADELKGIYGDTTLRDLNGKWCHKKTGQGQSSEVFPVTRVLEYYNFTKYGYYSKSETTVQKAEENFRKDLWHFWYNELVDVEALNEQRK